MARSDQYIPPPCTVDCERTDPELIESGRNRHCTCGNDDQCETCGGWGLLAHGPYDIECADCGGGGWR